MGVFITCGVLLAVGLIAALAAEVAVIELKSRIEVNSDSVYLKDLAKIGTSDPLEQENLGNIVVVRAPLPGKSRRIKRPYIELKLRQHEIDPARVRFEGPSEVLVGRGSIQADRAIIRSTIADYLQRTSPWAGTELKIKAIQITSDTTLPVGHTVYSVIAPRRGPYTGTVPLAVRVNVNDNYEKIIQTRVKLAAFKTVVVARRPIGRLKPISPADLERVKVDIGDLPPEPVTDINAAVGKRARTNIMARSVLRSDLIEYPPVVKRGDMVLIVAQSGALRITAIGEVRSSGRPGVRVKVINVDSKKAVSARVVDKNTVSVDF